MSLVCSLQSNNYYLQNIDKKKQIKSKSKEIYPKNVANFTWIIEIASATELFVTQVNCVIN
jgi:hypothetical protein